MRKKRQQLIVILIVAGLAIVGTAVSQVFFLGHKITTERRGVPAGTSLLGPGGDSNRMPNVSLASESGESKLKGKYKKLAFDSLANWTYIEGKTPIPDEVHKFDEQFIEMTGFMMPLTQTDKITEFTLMQSLADCCYGQSPRVNHVVMVKMKDGQAVKFYPEPIKVRGKFSVGETRDNGYLVSLYRLEADEIQAK